MRLTDGNEIPTTRNLIRVTGWIATARIAYEAQQYVVRKRDSMLIYQKAIHDQWTPLLAQIEQRCRLVWQYRIPPTAAERAELQTIVETTLKFENDFLLRYRQFLLQELAASDSMIQHEALRLMQNTLYADPDIIEAIQGLVTDAEPVIQATARSIINASF